METYKNGVEGLALFTYPTYASREKFRWLKMEILIRTVALCMPPTLE